MAETTAIGYVPPTNEEFNRRVPINQIDIAANSNTTFDLDSDDANYFKVTFTSDCTLSFTFPAGEVASIQIQLIGAGGFTVTLPTMQWANGVTPTFSSPGTDIITILHNGDNVLFGSVVGQNFS